MRFRQEFLKKEIESTDTTPQFQLLSGQQTWACINKYIRTVDTLFQQQENMWVNQMELKPESIQKQSLTQF